MNKRMNSLVTVFGLEGAAAFLALPATAQEVTFAEDVAPIIYESCIECHRPGSFAPMSLMTYDDARRYARMIRYRVSQRQMPPWHVDQTVGVQRFANDVSLSDEEIQTIVSWVDQGMARGDDRNMPQAPDFGDGRAWQAESIIGRPPDIIVRSSPYTVKAGAQDQWWNPLVDWEALDEERWMMAYEFKPAYPNG